MEEEYKKTLLQIANWILNPQSGSILQPLNAYFANQIGNVALDVANGKTLLEAIEANK